LPSLTKLNVTCLQGGRKKLKKLFTLVVMLAIALVVAVPAIAQVDQEGDQESDSGEVDQTFTVSGAGSNGNQGAGIVGNANTGNSQNQIDLVQYASDADDFEFDEVGSNLDVLGTGTTTCDQTVNQAAAAG
jgi:hypothetical protein